MRVSFTDQWPTFLDENGKPLIGRIKFMKADASQFKNVFYENNLGQEVPAPNPCYTLQDGRLEHQLFLDYGVYTCIVEKFVGTDWQNMLDYADDPTYWEEYKRFKAYGGEEIEGETSDLGSGFCDTIAALRTINPTEHSVVDVVGYYSKDDKIAPRTYVWVEGNVDAEDFGSTILSSLSDFAAAGRWKLCETPVLCSTTFGVFPDRGNTITASELSAKASALAQFANASKCSEVFFPAGHYYLATGTTISFHPKVTSNGKDTSPLMFDADGVQREEEVVGNISVSFLGGLEVMQDYQLCDNGAHTSFSFGAGTIKTSWLRYGTSSHIHNSSAFSGIRCILNYSSSTTFCNSGDTFNDWTFVAGDIANNQYIQDNVTFNECRFIGKCFGCGNNLTFKNCGEVRTSKFKNQIKDNSVWLTSGEVKAEGTTFLVDGTMEMVQSYGNNVIDNKFLKVVSADGILFNRTGGLKVFKTYDESLKFRGNIIFSENKTGMPIRLDMYYNFTDCYSCVTEIYTSFGAVAVMDLCGQEASIAVTDQTILPFKNGTINIDCSDADLSNVPVLHLENANIGITPILSGARFILSAKDCVIDDDGDDLILEDADCEGCTFNNDIRLVNQGNSRLAHKFNGCTFNGLVTLDATAILSNVHCDVVITGCTFDSSENPAIAVDNQQNFISDEYNKYVICNNILLGDAKMLPVDEVSYTMTTKFNGQTPSEGEYSGTFITPTHNTQTAGIAGDQSQYVAQVNSNGYALSALSERIFHVGTPNISVEITANPNFSDSLYYVIPANTALGKTNGSSFSFSSGIFILFNYTSNDTTHILSVDSNVRIKRILA